MEPYSVTID